MTQNRDVEELAEIIQDINFESYGFSHEEVAHKTARTIIDKGWIPNF